MKFWIQLINQGPQQVYLHPSSLCFGQEHFQCPYLASFVVQQTKQLYAREVTEVVPLALLLFGEEPAYSAKTWNVSVGGFVRFRCGAGNLLLPLITAARQAVSGILARKLEDPSFDCGSSRELAAVRLLLGTNGLCFERLRALTLPARSLQQAGRDDNPVRRVVCAAAELVHGVAFELADGARRGTLLDGAGRPMMVSGDGNWTLRGGRWEELAPDEWVVRVEGVQAKAGSAALCGALAIITNLGRELGFVGNRVDLMLKGRRESGAPAKGSSWRAALDAALAGTGRVLESFEFEAFKGGEVQEVLFRGDGGCRGVVRAKRRTPARSADAAGLAGSVGQTGPATISVPAEAHAPSTRGRGRGRGRTAGGSSGACRD